MPRTGRTLPLSASSPIIKVLSPSAWLVWLPAIRIAVAIARSKLVLSFGISAGARLTVIRFFGNLSSALVNAPRNLSLASSTALLASPTMIMLGRPLDKWHSTSITTPVEPDSITLCTVALMLASFLIE